ncbi:MAG: magnesium chelatase domain-containing protein, partial [Alphaproteobacteria bacterium]
MSIRVNTVAFEGVRARKVEVQVQIASGLPSFAVVGLPDKAVMEAKERVRAALSALGVALPAKRITINLAPADLPKEGSHFDLPIILALMAAIGLAPQAELDRYCALGELSLDGTITPVSGVLAAAMLAVDQDMGLICPAANGPEAAFAGAEFDLIAPPTLPALLDHLKGERILVPPPARFAESPVGGPDLADIKGQEGAKRAMEVAAAGGHNMAMVGPPGSGKSMLAARLPGLLPPLAATEMLEVGIIRSLAGEGGVES